MDKHNEVYPYNGILFSHKKERSKWFMLKHAQILKTLCQVKETGNKRQHII